MNSIIDTCRKAALEAGHFLMEHFQKSEVAESIIEKEKRSLATKIDQDSESMIISIIKSVFPTHNILAEESEPDLRNTDPDTPLWIIDPLDGTHNYIKGIPLFGVSVGVLYKGDYIAGAVYMPVEKNLYNAESGGGSFRNNDRIHVSSVSDTTKAGICFDSSFYQQPEKMTAALAKLSAEVFNVRIFGTTVRTLTYLAEGTIDAAVEYYDMPWDFAGSVPIIREAGAVLCDISGGPFTPDSRGYIAAAPGVFEDIKRIIV